MLLIITGCSQEPANPQTQQSTEPASTDTVQPVPAPQPAAEEPNQMDEKTAVSFTAKAISAYWHVMAGGKPAEDGAPIQSFLVEGMDYRYLGTDLDTKEKLYAYLERFFTREAVDDFIKHARIIEYNGKMAQPNADGGSILQWDQAEASLAKEEPGVQQYEFKVPFGDGASVQFQPVMVEMKQLKGNKGWRISTPPQNLK